VFQLRVVTAPRSGSFPSAAASGLRNAERTERGNAGTRERGNAGTRCRTNARTRRRNRVRQ
jgi:hypothetical protein